MGADELDQTALLRWIDVELGTDVPEVSVPLRRMVARSAQLELIAHRARDVVSAQEFGDEAEVAGQVWILSLALIELDTNPMLRAH